MNRRRLGWVGVWMLVLAGGCSLEVVFDPFGGDFSLEGDWTINGVSASAGNCGPIADVRVVLLEGGRTFTYPELTFACEGGSFQTDRIFAYGSYQTVWQALSVNGVVIAESQPETLIVNTPTTQAILRGVDFTVATSGDLRVALRYEDLKDFVFDGCLTGPDTISYMLSDGDTVLVDEKSVPCTDELRFVDLDFAAYSLTVTGRATGASVDDWSVRCDINHGTAGALVACDVPAAP